MNTVELKQAKNQFNELLEAVLKGEEIIITAGNAIFLIVYLA